MLTRPKENTKPQSNHTSLNPTVQTKLEIGEPDDKYEREADDVADKVMMMPSPGNSDIQMSQLANTPELQMMKAANNPEIQLKCKECKEEEGEMDLGPEIQRSMVAGMGDDEDDDKLQMKPAIQRSGNSKAYASPEITEQINNSKGKGSPLPENTNRELSDRIGTDFRDVRIHNDSNAAQLNKNLGSKAFTHGNDIYFNEGKYNPERSNGKHLLAHELTHTIQQGSAVKTKIQRKTSEEIIAEINVLITEINAEPDELKKVELISKLRKLIIYQYGPTLAAEELIELKKPGVEATAEYKAMKSTIQTAIKKIKQDTSIKESLKNAKLGMLEGLLEHKDFLSLVVRHQKYFGGGMGHMTDAISNSRGNPDVDDESKCHEEIGYIKRENFVGWIGSVTASIAISHLVESIDDNEKIGEFEGNDKGKGEGGGGGAGLGGGKSMPPKPGWLSTLNKEVHALLKDAAKTKEAAALPDKVSIYWIPPYEEPQWGMTIKVKGDTGTSKKTVKKYVRVYDGNKATEVFEKILAKVPGMRKELLENLQSQEIDKGEDKEAPKWVKTLKAKVWKKLEKAKAAKKEATDIPDKLLIVSTEPFEGAEEEDKSYQFQVWKKMGEEEGKVTWGSATLSYLLSEETPVDEVVSLIRKLTGGMTESEASKKGEEVPEIDPNAETSEYPILPPFPARIEPLNLRLDQRTVVNAEHKFRMALDFAMYYHGDLGLIAGASAASQTSYSWIIYKVPSDLEPTEKELGGVEVPDEGLSWKAKAVWLTTKFTDKRTITAASLEKKVSSGREYGSEVELTFPNAEGDYIVYAWATQAAKMNEEDPSKSFVRASSHATMAVRLITDKKLAEEEVEKGSDQIKEVEEQAKTTADPERKKELEAVVAELKAGEQMNLLESTAKSVGDTKKAIEQLEDLHDFLDTQTGIDPEGTAAEDPLTLKLQKVGLLDTWVMLKNSGLTFKQLKKNLEEQQKQLESLQTRIGDFKDDVKKGGREYKPIASLVSNVDGTTYPLLLSIMESADSTVEDIRYSIVDVSSPKTQQRYDGSSISYDATSGDDLEQKHFKAIQSAWIEFGEANKYGDGYIAFRVPSHPIYGNTTYSIKSEEGTWETVKRYLGYLAMAAGIAALVLGTVATGGALGVAAGGLGVFSAVVGAGLAIDNISQRASGNRLEFDAALVLDIIAIAGGVMAGVGAAARAAGSLSKLKDSAKWVTKVGLVDDVVQIYGVMEMGATVIFTSIKVQQDIEKIQKDPTLTTQQKKAMIAQVVQNAIQTGAMMMVSGAALAKNGLPKYNSQVKRAGYKSFEDKGWLKKNGDWSDTAPPTLKKAQTTHDATHPPKDVDPTTVPKDVDPTTVPEALPFDPLVGRPRIKKQLENSVKTGELTEAQASMMRTHYHKKPGSKLSYAKKLAKFKEGNHVNADGNWFHPHSKRQRDFAAKIETRLKASGDDAITTKEADILRDYNDANPKGTKSLDRVLTEDIRTGRILGDDGRFTYPDGTAAKRKLPDVLPTKNPIAKPDATPAVGSSQGKKLAAAKRAYEAKSETIKTDIETKSASDLDYKTAKEASFQSRQKVAEKKAAFDEKFAKDNTGTQDDAWKAKRDTEWDAEIGPARKKHSKEYDRGQFSTAKGDKLESELDAAGFGTKGSTSDTIPGKFPGTDGKTFDTAADLRSGNHLKEVKAGRLEMSDSTRYQIYKYAQLKNAGGTDGSGPFEVTYILNDGAAASVKAMLKDYGIKYIDLSAF